MRYIKLYEQFNEYVDEYNKKIVWDNGLYQISISSDKNPSRISLWEENTNIGNLYLGGIISYDDEKYHKVDVVDIDSKFRGKGLSKVLYNIALKYITTDGIISYLPNRVNHKQVPKIYKSLGGFIKDDYAIIPKVKNKKSELLFNDIIEIANKYDVKPTLIESFIDELKYEYNVNRRSLKSLNTYLIDNIKYAIEYEDRKPRDFGYGRKKQFQNDLEKISNLNLNDLIIK